MQLLLALFLVAQVPSAPLLPRRAGSNPAAVVAAASAQIPPAHSEATTHDPTKMPAVQWTLAIVQVLGFLALVVYVVKTWEIAKATRDAAVASATGITEMRLSREAATAPHVAIYFSAATTQFAEIVLENFGEGTAANVRCSFDPPLQSTMNGDPAQFFAVPKWLPPRSRLSHGFDTWMHYLPSKLPRKYQVTVEYSDVSLTKAYKHEYVLDASSFEHMLKWEQKGLHELVKVADDLKSQLRSSLDRAGWIEDARDRVSEVLPISASPDEGVATILSSWDLFGALVRAPHVMAFDTPYRSVMSRAAASALAAAVRIGVSTDQRQLIENVFVAVHHHDFDVMVDHAPAQQSLEEAVVALRTNWVFSPEDGPPGAK